VEKQLHERGLPVLPLGDVRLTKAIKAVTKFRKRVYVPKGGIPLLSSKQLFQVDPIGVKGLAKGAHEDDLEEICIAENMIAITRSGTIGRVQIIPRYMDGWANSEHTIRAIATDDLQAGYLYAWLTSPYGQALISRYSYGSVIVEIDRFMVGQIPVPILPNAKCKAIAALVLDANRLRDEAWQLERGALHLLSSEIESRE
jgi:type I restriction enzyme S subunit